MISVEYIVNNPEEVIDQIQQMKDTISELSLKIIDQDRVINNLNNVLCASVLFDLEGIL